jgi:short-subunit dehydrogenase
MESHTESNRPVALITGFSSGIGFEYSKYLAANNWDLELVAQILKKQKSHSIYYLIHTQDIIYVIYLSLKV